MKAKKQRHLFSVKCHGDYGPTLWIIAPNIRAAAAATTRAIAEWLQNEALADDHDVTVKRIKDHGTIDIEVSK